MDQIHQNRWWLTSVPETTLVRKQVVSVQCFNRINQQKTVLLNNNRLDNRSSRHSIYNRNLGKTLGQTKKMWVADEPLKGHQLHSYQRTKSHRIYSKMIHRVNFCYRREDAITLILRRQTAPAAVWRHWSVMSSSRCSWSRRPSPTGPASSSGSPPSSPPPSLSQ